MLVASQNTEISKLKDITGLSILFEGEKTSELKKYTICIQKKIKILWSKL